MHELNTIKRNNRNKSNKGTRAQKNEYVEIKVKKRTLKHLTVLFIVLISLFFYII